MSQPTAARAGAAGTSGTSRSARIPSDRLRRPSGTVPRSPESLLREQLGFLGTFLREPLQVGSVWPSSSRLAGMVVDQCSLESRRMVVELGPGTGSFTRLILERLHPQSQFMAMEINPTYVRQLRTTFPQLQLHADCAGKLPEYLRRHYRAKADCIISGLAWGNMLPATQARLLDAVLASLAPGGVFTTFAYAHARWFPTAMRFRRCLLHHFSQVEHTPIVWKNFPPAFVYSCRRDS